MFLALIGWITGLTPHISDIDSKIIFLQELFPLLEVKRGN